MHRLALLTAILAFTTSFSAPALSASGSVTAVTVSGFSKTKKAMSEKDGENADSVKEGTPKSAQEPAAEASEKDRAMLPARATPTRNVFGF